MPVKVKCMLLANVLDLAFIHRLTAGNIGKSLGGSYSTLNSMPSSQPEPTSPIPLETHNKTKSATFLEYSGPNCYIKPKAKTNLQIIRNAICAVCLAGDVNNSLKQNVLKVHLQIPQYH